jgi:nitrogen regulatory protein P-II 1
MKMILAVIQPTKLKALRESLERVGVTRMTVCDAQGFGRQLGRTEMYRGNEYQAALLRKIELEILVNDDFVERAISTILSVARTGPEGTIGDGKIFVIPAERVVRISDTKEGPEGV